MIKLLKVEQLEEKRFSILVSVKDKEEMYFVHTQEHLAETNEDPMWFIVPEDESFFEIWGQDLGFRRDVANSIEGFRKEAISELQLA